MAGSFFDKKSIILMILEALLFGGLLIGISTCSNRQIKQADQNIRALRSRVEMIELENGQLIYEKESLVLQKRELEDYLDISKSEVRDLERSLQSKLSYISKLEGQISIKPDIIVRDSLIYVDSTLTRYKFNYNDKWFSFNGLTEFNNRIGTTTINNVYIPVPLKVGLTDDYNIFVQSDNPYLSFTDIQGAAIDKSKFVSRPKRWNIGIQAGFGAQYGMVRKSFDYGPYIGVGLSYGFSF